MFSCNTSNYVAFNGDKINKKWLIDTGAFLFTLKYETVVALRVPIIRPNIHIKRIGRHMNTINKYILINIVPFSQMEWTQILCRPTLNPTKPILLLDEAGTSAR